MPKCDVIAKPVLIGDLFGYIHMAVNDDGVIRAAAKSEKKLYLASRGWIQK